MADITSPRIDEWHGHQRSSLRKSYCSLLDRLAGCHGDERIRILHLLPRAVSGGVERRRLELARGLDPERFVQRVVCLEANEFYRDAFQSSGVQLRCLGGGTATVFDTRTISRVARHVIGWRPDIVHGAVFEGVTMAALGGLLGGASRIVIEEIGDPSIRSWRGTGLLAALARTADVCIGVSPVVTYYLQHSLRLHPDRVLLIPNGVGRPRLPTDEELRDARRELDLPAESFVIGSVGRMEDDQKRFGDLIDAVKLVAPDIPNLRLLLVGEGTLRERLERRAHDQGIADIVRFAGYRSDVGTMYGLMDLFALASEQESFGLVLVEAMFCGLPIVATSVGGVPHVVRDGESALLVPRYDPPQLANALGRLHSDPQLSRRIAQAGRRRAEAHFTAERYVSDVERLYLRLVSQLPGTVATS